MVIHDLLMKKPSGILVPLKLLEMESTVLKPAFLQGDSEYAMRPYDMRPPYPWVLILPENHPQ